MSRIASLFLALLLAACGVDGAPIKPNGETAPANGFSISGTAKAGVTGGS